MSTAPSQIYWVRKWVWVCHSVFTSPQGDSDQTLACEPQAENRYKRNRSCRSGNQWGSHWNLLGGDTVDDYGDCESRKDIGLKDIVGEGPHEGISRGCWGLQLGSLCRRILVSKGYPAGVVGRILCSALEMLTLRWPSEIHIRTAQKKTCNSRQMLWMNIQTNELMFLQSWGNRRVMCLMEAVEWGGKKPVCTWRTFYIWGAGRGRGVNEESEQRER